MVRAFAGSVALAFFAAAAIFSAHAEEAKLGRDDFLSTSLSAIVDKVDDYTSGKKRIMSKDAMGASDEDEAEYEEDAMGRPVPKSRPKFGREAALNDPI